MTWQDVYSHIARNYKFEDLSENKNGTMLKMVWNLDGGRSQVVFINRDVSQSDVEWVSFYSPVGQIPPVLLPKALFIAGDGNLSGGLVTLTLNDCVFVKNAFPLEIATTEVVDSFFRFTMNLADRIENEVLGQDVK
ncbi:MAG: hypothetical protein LBQ80_01135 [Clostridium sp.]|jgi:hypothetical protein|nr:hypothetical protein [Clostridium sp.]